MIEYGKQHFLENEVDLNSESSISSKHETYSNSSVNNSNYSSQDEEEEDISCDSSTST